MSRELAVENLEHKADLALAKAVPPSAANGDKMNPILQACVFQAEAAHRKHKDFIGSANIAAANGDFQAAYADLATSAQIAQSTGDNILSKVTSWTTMSIDRYAQHVAECHARGEAALSFQEVNSTPLGSSVSAQR